MADDLINALKATENEWEPLSDELLYPLETSINPEYLKRTKSLLSRWERETGSVFDEGISAVTGFGMWLRDTHRNRIGPVSWRSYRYQCMRALPYADFISIVDVPPSTTKDTVALATSRYRQRHLKEHALNILKRHFASSRSPLADDIVDILHATLDTGLRPSEWGNAELRNLEGSIVYLWVKNAKKGTRQHHLDNTHRPIPLGHLSDSQLNAIKNTIARFKSYPDPKEYQGKLLKVLGSAVRACFYGQKSKPTLYSARHQFAANLKASNISPELIAVVMGHNSIELQTHHYGRKVNGNPIMINEHEIEELARKLLAA